VGNIPGVAKYNVSFSEEDVLEHVGRPRFVNITESYYSCVDGRYRAGEFQILCIFIFK
jgi:hypothetical protein